MAEDWAADVKKYDPGADDGISAGIVRYCGLALRNRDSSLVSFSDPAETVTTPTRLPGPGRRSSCAHRRER